VGLGSAGPLFGGTESGTLAVAGDPSNAANGLSVNWHDIDPHYFHALGRSLVEGRPFADSDAAGAAAVAIVNETFADRVFPSGSPIGQRVIVDGVAADIVGVVADVPPFDPQSARASEIYWPIRQYPRLAAYLVMRLTPGVAGVEAAARTRARAVDPSVQITAFSPLERIVTNTLVSPRFNMALIAAFAAIATLLAAVGVYGLMAAAVADRTREMGIRLALGARPSRVVAEIVGSAGRLTAVGLALGLVGAWAASRFAGGAVAGAEPLSVPVVMPVAGLLAAIAVLAAFVPARRAARVDPVATIRDHASR
jgi:ABC-type antimicrobial peptide transport system permease subunit